MSLHSIATAGLRSVSLVPHLHTLRFHRQQNGLAITFELLTSSLPGAPVVDDKGTFIGFISEFDVLDILETGRDVSHLTAEEIMVKDHIAIQESVTLKEAVELMKEKHLLVLPVERNGVVLGSVSRQSLLRTWIGLELGTQI